MVAHAPLFSGHVFTASQWPEAVSHQAPDRGRRIISENTRAGGFPFRRSHPRVGNDQTQQFLQVFARWIRPYRPLGVRSVAPFDFNQTVAKRKADLVGQEVSGATVICCDRGNPLAIASATVSPKPSERCGET